MSSPLWKTRKATDFPPARRAMPGSAPMSAESPPELPAPVFSAAAAPGATTRAALAQALGGLKGPMMKVAQMMASVPDLLPPEYAEELQKLQSEAPPMGAAFVKRRMQAELGPDWRSRFAAFDTHPAAAASLGQVHRAVRQGRRRARLQTAISGHEIGRRSRSASARYRVRAAPAPQSGHRYKRNDQGNRRSCPRGARLLPRSQDMPRSIAIFLPMSRTFACLACGRNFRPRGC